MQNNNYNYYNNNVDIIPVISYINADKSVVYKENKNKSGIYC
jgi:hypothetical protein